jgi:hypothetical protein
MTKMNLMFLDLTNNIFHICRPEHSLQQNFDEFCCKVRRQGVMDLCLGRLRLWQFDDRGFTRDDEGFLKLDHVKAPGGVDVETYWRVKPLDNLVWPAGLTYDPPRDNVHQYPHGL